MKPMRQFSTRDVVDFIVIGAGAAGGVVASELAKAGFQTVVLEQGPWLQPEDFAHDEVAVMYRAGIINNHKVQPNTFRRTPDENARVQPAVEYAKLVGGGSVHFTTNYWRFHPDDFRERSLLGGVSGADLQDWPITYDELEPYYTKAEWELGISGLGGSNPFDGPRSKPYPLPPLPAKSSGVLFDRAAAKLGLHSFPAPLAVLSQPYRGRMACTNCGFCEAFGCEMGAKSSTLAALVPGAAATGNCEIRPNSYVQKIETDDRGRASAVVYFDSQRRTVRQRARAVVVCANGAETPRLLLLSASKQHPNGLANSSGAVGKYLMFDTGLMASGVMDKPLNEYKGVVVSRVLHDYYASDPKRGFYGGAGLDARFDLYPAGFALDGMPKTEPQWGSEWKRNIGHRFTRMMGVLSHTSCLAMEQNSITLDPAVKDAWGLPAMRVTFRNHEDDLKTMRFAGERQREMLEAAGAKTISIDPVVDVTYSRHLMGTCRMGNDPRTSVVDRWNRSHDVHNLFVVDGSSLVTSARQQPTATIQALAFRASEYMAQAARRGDV